ncbi:MAG: 50S ribosomal protein L17 [Parcubacteria group bacterium]|nr:50S ribosomal protein L17 [Parcubacteria group bacterium]
MRKLKKGRKFGLKTGPRKALLRSLAEALILREKIRTTEAKAKEIAPIVERYVTKAKSKNLASYRNFLKILPKESAKKLFDEIAPRYQARSGGYTRIVKTGRRSSDGGKTAILEFVK